MLNKADLADDAQTARWLERFRRHEAFTYQLQYIPKIKLVSRAELAQYRDLLKQCRNDWQPADLDAEKPAGTLENDKSVKFYMPYICLQKSIDMLEKVTK